MVFLHAFLLLCGLLIVARLMELQIVDRTEYAEAAQSQHFGGVTLPARRGEILGLNSKTQETTILATNTTLDLLYVDPKLADDPAHVADVLADTLLTQEFHSACSKGEDLCPRELIPFYVSAFDPLTLLKKRASGAFLEPLPSSSTGIGTDLPDLTEARRRFAHDPQLGIERRISEKRVTFVPLKYSATKIQMQEVERLGIPGIGINVDQNLIFANPEDVDQEDIISISRKLAPVLEVDPASLQQSLRTRPLRYVAIMRRLPPRLSLRIKELKLASIKETQAKRAKAVSRLEAEKIHDPLRSIAIIQEHWRYYPDPTIASQIVGFLNTNQEAQYGIERVYDAQLRGQKGLIRTVSDLQGGQILTDDQRIIDPRDGDVLTLTIDPFVQKEVERILDAAVKDYSAQSGQAIVMDPFTGRIIALANSPLFDRNNYGDVYEKEPIMLSPDKQREIVVEIYHPLTNARIVKDYLQGFFAVDGRKRLPADVVQTLNDVEKLYELRDLARYYLYIGETTRIELFPTTIEGVWLKYKNTIGVGAYLNRAVQEIYEPGSVMKPITMAIAIDQGEIIPSDTYDDKGPVEVDEYVIKNALLTYYGRVTMTNCLEFSINTCMTSISAKLGKKLFHRMLERFGFGKITSIELEDELPGEMLPWRSWSNSLLATASFGQGVSATPLQVITAFTALANGGKLLKPTIIDSIRHPDGTVEKTEPTTLDQVITPQTSETITAMLVSSVEHGYAKTAKVKGYSIAGKTGTSQIAGPGGGYEAGTGSTVASFVGYAPAHRPHFLVLVKFDRPARRGEEHGASTAAPTFKDIATFLFKYYGLPPDEK